MALDIITTPTAVTAVGVVDTIVCNEKLLSMCPSKPTFTYTYRRYRSAE
jgi:hypothetical protein